MNRIEALFLIGNKCLEDPQLLRALEILLSEEAQAKEAPAPEKEKTKEAPEKKKKKPSVDTGRIEALRKGGWRIANIAEDVGCSQQTVRNHLAKVGLK